MDNVDLSEEFATISASYVNLLEGLAFIDEAAAEQVDKKFRKELYTACRVVFQAMTEDMAEKLAKPPKKNVRRKKISASNLVPQTAQYDPMSVYGPQGGIPVDTAIGVEELEENPDSFIGGSFNDDNPNAVFDNQQITNRSMRQQASPNLSSYQRRIEPAK